MTSSSNAQVFNVSLQSDHQQEDRTAFKPLLVVVVVNPFRASLSYW